jgi:phosphoglycerol transferase MdoB-like AlkP superfamily enzyme
MERNREASPRFKARVAGLFYVLAVLTAAFAEGLVRGRLLYAAGLLPVACFVVVTLLLYQLFKPAGRSLALLAALFNLVSLTFEALELHLWGVNIALIFHGLYCLLIGFLVFRSAFLPRILGLLMALGGLAWLTDLSIPLTDHLSPYNVISGFVGEGSLMLWLLVIGVNGQRWKAQASAETAGRS